MKRILMLAGALALTLSASALLVPTPIHHGAAQSAPRYVISAVDLEIVPAELDKFIEAIKENGAATIKEPGCRQYDILQMANNPNQIFLYEVYENEVAVQAHRASEHFKKYLATTANMVVKRQSRSMLSIALNSKAK